MQRPLTNRRLPCTEKAGDSPAAAKAYADFLAAWKDADAQLPQLAHARTYVAEHAPAATQTHAAAHSQTAKAAALKTAALHRDLEARR